MVEGDANPHLGPEFVGLELELRDGAEVAAAAVEGPEEIGVLGLADGDDLGCGSDELEGQEVVAGEGVLARKPADAAPSARPPTPVSETMPAGTIMPCSAVAASTSPRRHPPPTVAVLLPGLIWTPRMRVRSIVRPSSARALPVTPCPPHRTEVWRPCWRARFTEATTSSVVAQRAMTMGFLSTIAFQIVRASS